MRPTQISARCFLLLLLIAGFGASSEGLILPNLGKLDPLLQQVAGAGSGSAPVIVQASSSGALGAVALLVQQVGGTLGRQLPILDAQVADVPNASLLFLAASANVKRIAFDRPTISTMER